MSTEFLAFQTPPGNQIANYNPKLYHNEQPSTMPSTFLDAMSIREEVFVDEQKTPISKELDDDDSRSYHWVTYASVNKSFSSSSSSSTSPPNGGPDSGHKRDSTGSRLPVGTIRLVPPPHHPHPGPVQRSDKSEKKEQSNTMPQNEPYIKLGRLATIKPFRKLGLGKMLMDTALGWAARHPDECGAAVKLTATGREHARAEGGTDGEEWKGLVLVHAQSHLQKFYRSFGLVRDESMGEWLEEGIWHVGMWMRLQVEKEHK